jgi:hypothetical protein
LNREWREDPDHREAIYKGYLGRLDTYFISVCQILRRYARGTPGGGRPGSPGARLAHARASAGDRRRGLGGAESGCRPIASADKADPRDTTTGDRRRQAWYFGVPHVRHGGPGIPHRTEYYGPAEELTS